MVYNSGNNSILGNAFAAYTGIMNAAWNTGINANTGDCCVADDAGGSGGDD